MRIVSTSQANLLKLDSNRRFFSPCDLEIWWMTSTNNRASLLYYIKLYASFEIHQWIQTRVTVRKRPNWVKIDDFLVVCPRNLTDDLENNRAPFLCLFKLCELFRRHWLIERGVTVRKPLIWVKINVFFSRVTLRFDGWSWKTIGHLFYATSNFVHHFVPIGEFKRELQSGNAQSGSNLAVWPWNLTDDLENNRPPFLASSSSAHHYIAICVVQTSSYSPETAKWGYDLCDLDLWPLTLAFCMAITSVDYNMWLCEHSEKGVTDGPTDRRTDR